VRTLVGSVLLHAAIATIAWLVLPGHRPDPVCIAVEVTPVHETLLVIPPRRDVVMPAIVPGPVVAATQPAKTKPQRRAASKPAAHAPEDHDAEATRPAGTGSGDGSGSGSGDGEGDGDGTGGGGGGAVLLRKPTPPKPIGGHPERLPYTREAIAAQVSGNVLVAVSIDAGGGVVRTELVRGLGHGLDPIAIELAKRLRFLPARDERDRPVAARITWRFHFAPPGPQP
jgi:TonB family protein